MIPRGFPSLFLWVLSCFPRYLGLREVSGFNPTVRISLDRVISYRGQVALEVVYASHAAMEHTVYFYSLFLFLLLLRFYHDSTDTNRDVFRKKTINERDTDACLAGTRYGVMSLTPQCLRE